MQRVIITWGSRNVDYNVIVVSGNCKARMSNTSDIPKQMLALRVNSGQKTAKLETINVPEISENDVLIKVSAAHLGPDVFKLVAMGRLQPLPTTLGHKVAGMIAAAGASVSNVKVGDRVRLDPNLNCGSCTFCNTDRDALCNDIGIMGFFALRSTPLFDRYHDGGLAQYVRAPASCVDRLADNLSYDVGAKVHDLANAAAVLKRAAFPVGSTLLITAATGSMGSCVVKLAPFFGVRRLVLVARSKQRLSAVKAISQLECHCVATEGLESDWESSGGLSKAVSALIPEGVDAAIDFSPSGTGLWQVAHSLRVDGSIVLMGGNYSVLPFSGREIGMRALRVFGHRNHSRQDSKLILQLLESGVLQVDDLLTHHFKLEDWEKAIDSLQERSLPAWTLSIHPPGFDT